MVMEMDERAINKRQMKLYAEASRYPASELSNKVKVLNLIEENILRKQLDIFEKEEQRSLRLVFLFYCWLNCVGKGFNPYVITYQ